MFSWFSLYLGKLETALSVAVSDINYVSNTLGTCISCISCLISTKN